MMKKKSNFFKILIIILCLSASVLFALLASGKSVPLVETYTKNFKRNISGICNMLGITLPIETQLYLDDMSIPTPKPTMMPERYQDELEAALGYPTEEEVVSKEGTALLTAKESTAPKKKPSLPIAVNSAGNSQFAFCDDLILCANETSYTGYHKNGNTAFSYTIQMQSPVLLVRGNYVLISETGGRKVSLYRGKKHIFTTETDGNIISCDMSKSGDIVLVCEKEFYKGQVIVINNDGKVIFAWDSGSYNILDATISESRRVGISLLNTDQGAASIITCLDVNGNNLFRNEEYRDNIIFDLSYIDGDLYGVSESSVMRFKKNGETDWTYDFGGRTLARYEHSPKGSTLLLFENSSSGELVTLSSQGKPNDPIKTELMPTSLDISGSKIAYNNGRDVIISKYKGTGMISATCDSDIRALYIIDKKHVLCVYTASIEIQKLEKVKKAETVLGE